MKCRTRATALNRTISCTITIWKFICGLPSAGKVTSHTWNGNIFSHQCTCNLSKLGGKSRRKSFEVIADDTLHCLLLNRTAETKKIDIKSMQRIEKQHKRPCSCFFLLIKKYLKAFLVSFVLTKQHHCPLKKCSSSYSKKDTLNVKRGKKRRWNCGALLAPACITQTGINGAFVPAADYRT